MRVTFDEFASALTEGLLRFARQEARLNRPIQRLRQPFRPRPPPTPPLSSKSSSAPTPNDEDDITVVANLPPLRILPSRQKAPPPSYSAAVPNPYPSGDRSAGFDHASTRTGVNRPPDAAQFRLDVSRAQRTASGYPEQRDDGGSEIHWRKRKWGGGDAARREEREKRLRGEVRGPQNATGTNNIPLWQRRRVKVEREESSALSVS